MTEPTTTRFSHQDELEQIGHYKRFNFLAVLGLVLGIASSGMLLNLFLWVVPTLGICFGMAALARIRKSDNLGGYAMAWTGIALSLFFATWASSSFYFQRRAIYREAKVVAENWFDLVFRGEDKIAHQAMLHPASRQAAGLSVDDYYKLDEEARKDKERLFSTAPVSQLLGLGEQAKTELVRNITQDVDLRYAQLIRQVYRVTAPGIDPLEVMVTVTRAWKDELGRATWIVADVEEAK